MKMSANPLKKDDKRLGRPRQDRTFLRTNEYKVVAYRPTGHEALLRAGSMLRGDEDTLLMLYWKPKDHDMWRLIGYVRHVDLLDYMSIDQWIQYNSGQLTHWERQVSITRRE
jgi:hypothetical protein